MFVSKVPSIGACVGSIATIYSLSNSVKAEESACHDCKRLGKRLPKARELPIYCKKEDDVVIEYDKKSELPLLNEISVVRMQISGVLTYLDVFKEKAVHVYETGIAHSQSSLDYMTSEENQIPRIITITSAGLLGILLARKGGYFKKAFYGSIGSGIAFSAFYPSTAKEYFSSAFDYTKHHTTNALEQYGGYDAKKISEDASQQIEVIKKTLMLEGVTNKMKEWFEANKEKASKTLKEATTSVNKKDEPTKTLN
ncbi:hypothetical protein JTE90_010062 [Oedothorax gibbosus]|uniref:MICOS complex subunit n=1 Tax=Oedothorax gibbosus TaxID=931172 RepID=A0AAV6UWV5_9ARAC|nr:hypothetical protein JTE90_010062 [Oedothorax gibbosus]